MKIWWNALPGLLLVVACGSDSIASFPPLPEVDGGEIDGAAGGSGGEVQSSGGASSSSGGAQSSGGASNSGGTQSSGGMQSIGADAGDAGTGGTPAVEGGVDSGPPAEAGPSEAGTDACGGCDPSATCDESGDAPECVCEDGYELSDGPLSACTDVDECATDADDCDANATCTNADGGFTCECNAGYEGDGKSCDDVDECMTSTDDCDANATCTNTEGGFTCECNAGYEGDGKSCDDVDECTTNTDDCHANATCTNTEGGFTCACDAGYQGNGQNCTDINECATNADNCHVNATCTNTPGSFTCACNGGFQGNGRNCTDINECATNTDNCDSIATCRNTAGSYTCSCPAGTTGNGRVCRCNLAGTWALLAEFDITYAPVTGLLEGGMTTTFSWAIRTITQSGANVSISTRQCGATSPDLCGTGLLAGQAFQQRLPANVWDLPTMPVSQTTMSLTGASAPDPNGPDPFVGPSEVALLGLDLSDPDGAWPASWSSNQITWLDHDNDGEDGMTSLITSTGTSSACGGAPYRNLPNPEVLATVIGAGSATHEERIAEVWLGSRSIASYVGTIADSCDVITGSVQGTVGGFPELNGHITGCVLANGSDCTQAVVDSLDAQGQSASQTITDSKFTMVRVANANITCAQVRAMSFP